MEENKEVEIQHEEKTLDEIQQEIVERKQAIAKREEQNNSSMAVSTTINNKLQTIFEDTVNENTEEVKALADNAVKTELEIKNEEVAGRKEVKKSEIRKNVTQAKMEEDTAKHERAKTILKSQGLTSQLPSIYRITALIVGFPFYLLYLLTFGWIIQILTFVVKGFITMVADCAERFADVNKKFIENDNTKQFKLGKAMINILKWILVLGVITTIVVLFIIR